MSWLWLWHVGFDLFLLVGASSKFWGVSGSEDRDRGDNSIQFINIGREGDKRFKEWRRKIGGGRVGDNSILTFLHKLLVRQKNSTLRTAFWAIFSIVFLIHRLHYWFERFAV